MHDHLPQVLAEIAQVAGIDAAWEICRVCGGQTIYLPRAAGKDHWLTALVGFEAASKICDYYCAAAKGTELLIPIARHASNKQRMIQALENGMSATKAAAVSGMHERTAFRVRKELRRKDKRQGNLF